MVLERGRRIGQYLFFGENEYSCKLVTVKKYMILVETCYLSGYCKYNEQSSVSDFFFLYREPTVLRTMVELNGIYRWVKKCVFKS